MSMVIQKAITYAAIKHEGQKRKGTNIPYIIHPMEVMQILTAMDCSQDVIIAGILHDILEDTGTKPEEIRETFGDTILALVQSESEDKSKTWKERKRATIDELQTASTETRLVCFADKLSNIRSMLIDKEAIGAKLWERFNASKEDIEWYYRSIAEVLKKTQVNGFCNFAKSIELFKEFEETIDKVFAG